MRSVNKAILVGILGKDVELKHYDNDRKLARLVVATNEEYKTKDGEKVNRTDWHTVEFWNGQAQVCADYLRKGSKVYIEGKNRTDEFEKEGGVKIYRHKIIGETFVILDSVGSNANKNTEQTNAVSQENATELARNQSKEYTLEPNVDMTTVEDDGMPF